MPNPTRSNSSAATPSRRAFLKTTAALSAAAALSSALPSVVYAQGSQRIRVGLIGCGGRGTGAADDCCKASPAVQIVAMGDLFRDHLDACRKNLAKLGEQLAVTDDHCFAGLDAYQKVIASPVDLVLLATPPGFRPLHFRAAVDAGKHVFFEKPVAVDPVGVRSIIESADIAHQKKLSVVAGTLFRHDPAHIEVIRRIHDGAIGDLIAGQSYYNTSGLWMHPRKPEWSDAEWQIRNWLYFTWLSGDHIVEQAIHRIDVMNWVMGATPVAAYGMGGRQVRTDPAYGNIFDHFAIEYEYPNGARVMTMCRQIDGTESRVTEYVQGTKGKAVPSASIDGASKFKYKGPTTNPYVQEQVDLIKSIVNGDGVNEAKQVAESSLTAIMGRMSAYTGKVVTWEHATKSNLDLFPKDLALGDLPVAPVAVPGKDPLI